MIAAVEPLEVCSELIRHIRDCQAMQAPIQCCGWYAAMRPEALGNLLIAGRLTD